MSQTAASAMSVANSTPPTPPPSPTRKQSPTTRNASNFRLPKPLENANYQTKVNLMFANHNMFNPMYCKLCTTNEFIVEDRSEGNFTCSKCGCVISRLIDFENNDWRDFDDEKSVSNSRVGKSTLEENEDHLIINESRVLGTRIDSSSLIKLGRKNIETNEFLNKLFKQVTTIVVDQLKLESRHTFKIKELLKMLHLENRRLFNQSSRNQCLAACLFCGLKSEGVGKTIKEFCVLLNVSKDEISKWISIIQKNPKTKELIKTKDYNSPQSYVEDFCKKLNLPISAISKIKLLIEKVVQSEKLSGKSPSTIASSCLFYFITTSADSNVVNLNIGEEEIEGATGITRQTLKSVQDSIISILKSH